MTVSTSDPTAVVVADVGQYLQLFPDAAVPYIQVEPDPTMSDLVSSAYFSVLIYIPSTIQPDLFAMGPDGWDVIVADDWYLNLRSPGTFFYFSTDDSGTGQDFLEISDLFDTWIQVEVRALAGASTYDVRINGTLYSTLSSPGLPTTGVNFFGPRAFPNGDVGGGGGVNADDWIGVDELSWSATGWISLGAASAAVWAFEADDPVADAVADHPDPPWFASADPASFVLAEGGGPLDDLLPSEGEGGETPAPPPSPIGCCADPGELTVRVYIAGTEVTNVAVSGSWTPRLNRPAQGTVTIPMDAALGAPGDLLRIDVTDGVDSCIKFHGRILNRELDTSKDEGRVVYNAQDAMEILQWRVVRDDDGDFSKPRIIEQYQTGPQIIQAVLQNSIDSTGRTSLDGMNGGPPPLKAEGPLPIQMGGFAGGGPSLTGAPVDWPMQISELVSLLISTGQVDVVFSPISTGFDPASPGFAITSQVDVYNGDYGTDRSGSVVFQYGMGAFNAAQVRWNSDMTNIVNKYWLYGGPSIETAADPKGDQHWCFNVTGDDPNLASPPGGDVQAPYLGGGGNPPGAAGNELGGRRLDSQGFYDVRMRVDIVDGYDEDCIPGFGTPGRDLYRYQWQVFSWLSAFPREIIHVTPVAGTQIGCFHIGDLIGVEVVGDVLGGFSGAQRVYQYTVSWEGTPSVLTLSEIQTSADNEQ